MRVCFLFWLTIGKYSVMAKMQFKKTTKCNETLSNINGVVLSLTTFTMNINVPQYLYRQIQNWILLYTISQNIHVIKLSLVQKHELFYFFCLQFYLEFSDNIDV